MAETKIIYHIDEEETPYLVKLSVSPEKVTLADFKNVLNNRPVNSYKFFFKSMDQDFGVVKEEISDDNAKLPCFNGRVVSWLVLAESAHSDGGSQCTESHPELPPPLERTGGIGDSRPPSFHANAVSSRDGLDTETGTESLLSHRRERERERARRRARETESEYAQRRGGGGGPRPQALEKYNFLGISIVGQSNDRGDGGIYIGSIMKGGAVAADGRIEPGDMLLQVNDVNFENMSNDDAVRILREIVSKTGPISLTVAKCWDPSPRSYFTIPRAEPVRPIDPAAWISHTTALTGPYPHYEFDDLPLSASKTDMATIVKVMQLPDSGLEIRDRMWLKITIANAVIGADVVDWLYSRVEGFKDRRDARKYASSLLKHGYLRHTVNKITFSEQCYYTFGDLCQNMASLNLNEGSSVGGSEQDTLAPLPPSTNPWPLGGQPFPYPPFPSAPPSFPPGYSDPCHSFHGGSAGSQHSEGEWSQDPGVRAARRGSDRSASQTSHAHSHARSGFSHTQSHRSHPHSQHSHPSFAYSQGPPGPLSPLSPPGPGSCAHSERSHASSYGPPGLPPPYCLARLAPKTPATSSTPPGAPPGRELAAVPPELTASRQSFQHAMGNPCEFFVDIM
uniref:Dishevelled segment polarity protein 1 n=1 Tax=Gadus morhua TaxID=8049 RepID=A0A8C5BHQ7_GADMO